MKNTIKRISAALVALLLVLSLVPALVSPAEAASYVANWGTREVVATELSDAAKDFYTGNNTYTYFAGLSGSANTSQVTKSELYQALQTFMASKQTYVTSYGDTRPMYQYTDCENGDMSSISSFYSGDPIGPAWDSGKTWNREHTWPNSKGDGDSENDIMMLRPTAKSENGSRGNKAYGESAGFYDPNMESGGKHDVRGDVARIMLYVYVRWGGSTNQSHLWGAGGVIESLEVMLKWMQEDPVDTWELGRNDSVQSITGARNVFVDYPELVFVLFGQAIPSDMVTPSGMAMNPPAVCRHETTEIRDQQNATCTAEGYTGDTYCVSCGEKVSDGQSVPAAHSLQAVAAQEATLEQEGNIAHWACTGCQKRFGDAEGLQELTQQQVVIPKLEPDTSIPSAPSTAPSQPAPTDPALTEPSQTQPSQTQPSQTQPAGSVPVQGDGGEQSDGDGMSPVILAAVAIVLLVAVPMALRAAKKRK